MDIKVLGAGCVKCRGLEHRVRKAVNELKLNAQISKVEDLSEIMRYQVARTPALVIDGKVMMTGMLPTYTELKSFLNDLETTK